MGAGVMSGATPAPAAPTAVPRRRKKPLRRGIWATRALFSAAALGAMQFVHAPEAARTPFAQFAGPSAWASGDAFGSSREVKLRFTLPNERVEFPLAVAEDPSGLRYEWVAASDTARASEP